MDNIQKQIIGYLLMAIVGAVIAYVAGRIAIWLDDYSLAVMLGFILTAIEIAAKKWISYTFNVPEEETPNDLPME